MSVLYVDIVRNQTPTGTTLSVLADEQGNRYLPIGPLARALRFRLAVDVGAMRASGFLSAPSDWLEMAGAAGEWSRKGKAGRFDSSKCFAFDGELYIDSKVIEGFTGARLAWREKRSELVVEIETDPWQVFPSASYRNRAKKESNAPAIRSPYRFWTPPSLDFQAYSSSVVDNSQWASDGALALDGYGDLFFAGAHYRYLSTLDGRRASYLSLSRDSEEGRLLGGMHATRVEVGDIFAPAIPMLTRQRSGVGVAVTNRALDRRVELGSIDGNAVPNSVVEAYRGDEPFGVQVANEAGKFRFDEIALLPGPNYIHLAIIEPDGRIRHGRRVLYGSDSSKYDDRPGYSLQVQRTDGSLFGNLELPGESKNDRTEYTAEWNMPLRSGTSLSANSAYIQSGQADQLYFGGGLNAWVGDRLWHVKTLTSASGGLGLLFGFKQQVGSGMFTLEHVRKDPVLRANGVDELGLDAASVTSVRWEGSTNYGARPANYTFGLDVGDSQSLVSLLRARAGVYLGRYEVNTNLAIRSAEPYFATVLLDVCRRERENTYRLGLGYTSSSPAGAISSRISVDRRLTPDYYMGVSLEYMPSDRKALTARCDLYRPIGPLALGVTLSADTNGRVTTSFGVSTAFSGASSIRQPVMIKPGQAGAGTVTARVFLDANSSGKFDSGDVLLPDVGFRVDGQPISDRSNERGVWQWFGLAPNQVIEIAVDENTLSDPSWVSLRRGWQVVARAGRTLNIDVPIVETVEVDGVVRAMSESSSSGWEACLVNEKGTIVATSRLDDRQSYVFSQVSPGDYVIRLRQGTTFAPPERKIAILARQPNQTFDIDFVRDQPKSDGRGDGRSPTEDVQ